MPTYSKSNHARQDQIPSDHDAELVILGNCLLQQTLAPLGDLPAEAFYSATHQKVAQALRTLAANEDAIDAFTLRSHLAADPGVQVSKLSSLTDGVPVLDEKYLAKYRARLEELQRQRETLRQAGEIGRAAETGASADEIQERAERILEKTKPPAPRKKLLYPQVPAEAWRGPAELYRQAVGASTEASDSYHLAYFLAAVGSLLGRTVYIRKGRLTYPNLYVVLVGQSGAARKGTAMDFALNFIRDIDPDVYITETVDSREGFILDLATGQKDLEERRISGELRDAVALEEFRSLIEKAEQKGVRNIIPTLCLLYDCPRTIANKSIHSPAKVNEPTTSLFSGTSPSYLQNLSLGDIEGGLGNRICWVAGDPKPRKDDPPDVDTSILNPLKMAVKEAVTHYRARGVTRFYLSPAAAKRYKDFYHKEYNLESTDELVCWLSERDHMTCLKVATIYAALDRAEREIEIHHLEAGIAFVKFLYEARFPIFSGHGVASGVRAQERILEIVQERGRLNYCELLPLMRRHVNAEGLARLLNALGVPGGPIRIETVGGSRPKRFIVWGG